MTKNQREIKLVELSIDQIAFMIKFIGAEKVDAMISDLKRLEHRLNILMLEELK